MIDIPELYLCVIVTIETGFTVAMYRLMETKKQAQQRKRAFNRILASLALR